MVIHRTCAVICLRLRAALGTNSTGRHRYSFLPSTDPRQRVAHQLVHHPPAAESRLHQHHARRLGLHLADLGRVARSPARAQRRERGAPPPRAPRRPRACPRWRRTSGRSRGSPPRPATAGLHRHRRLAHDHRHARGARQLVEHRRDAAARRVAQAAQRAARRRRAARRPPATASACRTRSAASSSNSPRASMIAVPCSPIGPDTRIAVARPQARRATARARGSTPRRRRSCRCTSRRRGRARRPSCRRR